MKLCKPDKCRWYSDPSKYGRKCYYIYPACILGMMDQFLSLFKLWENIRRPSCRENSNMILEAERRR